LWFWRSATDAKPDIDLNPPGVFLCPERAGAILKLKPGDATMANLDWSQCPAVESIPGKVSGAWLLRGTRMPVSAIFENIEAGANIDDLVEWFDGPRTGQVGSRVRRPQSR
jgi:uncharacterized protein (DUF433 family)